MKDQTGATTAVTTGSSGGAEDEEEALNMGELVPPETRDMEDQSEANTGSEDFATVYRSCFSDTMNNNLSVRSVNIGDEVLTIIGHTENLVKTASEVLNKYFNAVPEENESEAADSVESTLPGPASAVEMESSFQVDVLGGDGGDVGLGVELMETEDQEAEVTLPAPVTTSPVIAADTGAEEAEASAGQSVNGENVENSDCTKHYKCSVCQKQYKDKQYYRQHLKNHQYGKQYKGHSV